MGLFTTTTSEKIAPNRRKREICWDARDKYLDCLERNKIDNPLEQGNQKTVNDKCGIEVKDFEANCAKSWVHYFKEKYVVDLKKKRFMKEMEEKDGKALPFPINKK